VLIGEDQQRPLLSRRIVMATKKKKKKSKKTAVRKKPVKVEPVEEQAAPVQAPRRSSVSLNASTIDLARKMCRAEEDHYGRLPALNEIFEKALDLLEKDYKKKKVKIPKIAPALRPSPAK
jgi:hypothetical protein